MMTLLLFVVAVLAAGLGLFIFLKPAAAIEIQRRFYEMINWRIEPISMTKELHNTRVMGLFLVFLAALALAELFTGGRCLSW